jgi:hypothetical protein
METAAGLQRCVGARCRSRPRTAGFLTGLKVSTGADHGLVFLIEIFSDWGQPATFELGDFD